MTGRHLDDDGDGFADQSDPQSRAFRGMAPADRVRDSELRGHSEAYHPAADANQVLAEISLPEEHEGWDDARVGPKSPREAEHALYMRITDPNAPDEARHQNAYDHIEQHNDLGEGQPF